MSTAITNPFGKNSTTPAAGAMMESDSARAVAEVQAAIALAKRFPRDPVAAVDKILQACTRPTLAEQAVYAFPRGGTTVTGPSIRLAEAVAQHWGNMTYGVRELSQEKGESVVEAFAHDLETNVRVVKVFTVKHTRKARGKVTTLEDPRDIYEMTANQGARRLRACILAVIPGDVIDAALNQCQVTLENAVQVNKESVAQLVEAFEPFGVSREMLSRRLGGKHLEKMIGAEMIQLRHIYRALKDGMAKPEDFFDLPKETAKARKLKDKLAGGEAVEPPAGK